MVDDLNEKVNRYKEENRKLYGGEEATPLNQIEFVKVHSKDEMVDPKENEKKEGEEIEGFKVKIESKMLSLKSGELENRDAAETTEG